MEDNAKMLDYLLFIVATTRLGGNLFAVCAARFVVACERAVQRQIDVFLAFDTNNEARLIHDLFAHTTERTVRVRHDAEAQRQKKLTGCVAGE